MVEDETMAETEEDRRKQDTGQGEEGTSINGADYIIPDKITVTAATG